MRRRPRDVEMVIMRSDGTVVFQSRYEGQRIEITVDDDIELTHIEEIAE